jgi:Ca2+/H+ antiporter
MVSAKPSTIGSELINPKEVIFPFICMIAGLVGLIVVSSEAHLSDGQSLVVFGSAVVAIIPSAMTITRHLDRRKTTDKDN